MGGTEEIALPGSIRSHSDVIQVDEAVRIVRSITHITGTETIPLDDADGRTLAELISCPADVPGFLRSHLNGFAVLSSDTLNASPDHPCILPLTGMVRKGRGDHCTHIMGEAIRIETGGVIPSGSDAVVREEDGEVQSDSLFLKKPARSGENIIARDEDFKKGEPVYPSGWILRPQDIGVLASIGKTLVTVRKKPVIGIISTGRELISPDSIPDPGEVREVNSYLVSVFCRRQGAIPLRYGIVRDDEDTLLSLMRKATTECDAVIITGGSARDQNDVTARVIKRFGEVFSEYISFSPGKRTIIGRINSVLVIGLPGHPSATFMVLVLVVIHLIQALKGSPCQKTYRRHVRLADDLHGDKDKDRFIRVQLSSDSAVPVFGKAGLINLLTQSDGLVRIPAGCQGYNKGDMVEVMIW